MFVVYEITAVHMDFFCCPFSVVSLVTFRLLLVVNFYFVMIERPSFVTCVLSSCLEFCVYI